MRARRHLWSCLFICRMVTCGMWQVKNPIALSNKGVWLWVNLLKGHKFDTSKLRFQIFSLPHTFLKLKQVIINTEWHIIIWTGNSLSKNSQAATHFLLLPKKGQITEFFGLLCIS